jgi:Cu/Ag efflux pump CusA
MSDRVVGINDAELWVSIDPQADYSRTADAIRSVVDSYPGYGRSVRTYPAERIGQVLSSAGNDIVVRVYGQEQAILEGKAEEIRQALAGIDGVVNAQAESQVVEPTIQVEVDLEAAARYGVEAGDIRRTAAALLSGIQVGSLFEEQKVFDVVVWGVPEIRQSLTSVRDLLIETPGGGHVRLDDVADVRVASAPSVIRREGVMRRIDVGADIQGRDAGSIMREVESRLSGVKFPLEYHAEILRQPGEKQEALIGLLAVAAGVVIGIFLLLQAAFGSWRLAALVAVALPSALAGGMVGAFAAGATTIGPIVGFLAVFAIAVRQAMALIARYQHLAGEEGEASRADAIARAAGERLAPILATGVATGLVYLPFAVLGDVAGMEILRPMAAVVLCGLVTATLVTLFVVPALCLLAGPVPEADAATRLRDEPQPSAA